MYLRRYSGSAPKKTAPGIYVNSHWDYFSEKVTGSYAIKTIRNAWNTSRSSFDVSQRNNEIRYNAGATWEADRILKELPETLEAHKSREWVVMNLEEAKTFFEIPFRKSWKDRFQKR